MSEPIRSFDRITIPTPCNADWDSMVGNDQVRFCEHCNLNVTDLSAMTRQAAMRVVARSRGRLCVRYVQRPDGGILTRTVPQKFYRISRRVSRIAAGAFTATLSLSTAAAQTGSESSSGAPPAQAAIARTITQTEIGSSLSGIIFDPNGAVVSGAVLTLTNPRTSQAFIVTTADDGAYKFSLLDEGRYSLAVEAPSFAKSEMPELELRPNVTRTLNVAMEIPQVIAEVEVNANTTVTQISFQGDVVFVEPQEPLVKAAFKEDLAAVKQLVFTSLDVNVRDKATNTTALDQAAENGNLEIVRTLVRAGARANLENRSGRSPLMYLREKATVELVRELVSAGAKVNASDESGSTPLMNAAEYSNPAVVKELIENGARIDVKDDDGKTPLMFAAGNDDARIAKILIDAGAALNTKQEDGKTALMIAIQEGDPETVKLLISSNAEVNEKDDDGWTALMFAASARNFNGVQELLNAGADVTVKDDEGKTALSLARQNEEKEMVKLLESRGAPE